MALQSSGAISFLQIVAEFGGVGSHSLSEYYPLVGQGVAGLPSSGQFSFSQFHGKSKNVTTSVWTSSGYTNSGTNYVYNAGTLYWGDSNNNGNWQSWNIGGASRYHAWSHSYPSSISYGGYTYTKASNPSGNSGSTGLTKHVPYSNWVDTSGYVNTASVASIST